MKIQLSVAKEIIDIFCIATNYYNCSMYGNTVFSIVEILIGWIILTSVEIDVVIQIIAISSNIVVGLRIGVKMTVDNQI